MSGALANADFQSRRHNPPLSAVYQWLRSIISTIMSQHWCPSTQRWLLMRTLRICHINIEMFYKHKDTEAKCWTPFRIHWSTEVSASQTKEKEECSIGDINNDLKHQVSTLFHSFSHKSQVRYGLKPLKGRQKRIVSIILNQAEKLPLVWKLSILTKQFNNLGEICPAEQIKVDSSWRMLSASFDVSIESVLCWSFCCVRTSPPLVWMSGSDGRQRDLMI